MRKRIGPQGIGKIYGQEKNITTYNLARMNMLLHGVKDTEFGIFHGDTLLNEWDMMRGQNLYKAPEVLTGFCLWGWLAAGFCLEWAGWVVRELED